MHIEGLAKIKSFFQANDCPHIWCDIQQKCDDFMTEHSRMSFAQMTIQLTKFDHFSTNQTNYTFKSWNLHSAEEWSFTRDVPRYHWALKSYFTWYSTFCGSFWWNLFPYLSHPLQLTLSPHSSVSHATKRKIDQQFIPNVKHNLITFVNQSVAEINKNVYARCMPHIYWYICTHWVQLRRVVLSSSFFYSWICFF